MTTERQLSPSAQEFVQREVRVHPDGGSFSYFDPELNIPTRIHVSEVDGLGGAASHYAEVDAAVLFNEAVILDAMRTEGITCIPQTIGRGRIEGTRRSVLQTSEVPGMTFDQFTPEFLQQNFEAIIQATIQSCSEIHAKGWLMREVLGENMSYDPQGKKIFFQKLGFAKKGIQGREDTFYHMNYVGHFNRNRDILTFSETQDIPLARAKGQEIEYLQAIELKLAIAGLCLATFGAENIFPNDITSNTVIFENFDTEYEVKTDLRENLSKTVDALLKKNNITIQDKKLRRFIPLILSVNRKAKFAARELVYQHVEKFDSRIETRNYLKKIDHAEKWSDEWIIGQIMQEAHTVWRDVYLESYANLDQEPQPRWRRLEMSLAEDKALAKRLLLIKPHAIKRDFMRRNVVEVDISQIENVRDLPSKYQEGHVTTAQYALLEAQGRGSGGLVLTLRRGSEQWLEVLAEKLYFSWRKFWLEEYISDHDIPELTHLRDQFRKQSDRKREVDKVFFRSAYQLVEQRKKHLSK